MPIVPGLVRLAPAEHWCARCGEALPAGDHCTRCGSRRLVPAISLLTPDEYTLIT